MHARLKMPWRSLPLSVLPPWAPKLSRLSRMCSWSSSARKVINALSPMLLGGAMRCVLTASARGAPVSSATVAVRRVARIASPGLGRASIWTGRTCGSP
eukprot:4746206-Alexandrium_andersonii.AAC.1